MSFNIVFQLESGKLDIPIPVEAKPDDIQNEPDVELAVEDDDIVHDPDYVPQGEDEEYGPYEYDSDHESIDTTSDTQNDTEHQLYHGWASDTFHPRAMVREQPSVY